MFNFIFKAFSKLNSMHITMLVLVATLVLLGLSTMYDASGGYLTAALFQRQMIYASIFFIVMLLITAIDFRFFFDYAYIFYGLSVVLLIIVEIIGHRAMGATRWLNLGIIRIQPSEIVKVSLVLALARYFHFKSVAEVSKLKNLILPFVLFILPFVIIAKQPDLGTAITLSIVAGIIFFLAGMQIRYFVIGLAAILIAGPLIFNHLHDYQKKRILIFLNPEKDPLGAGYNILQSKIAIGSGGLNGKGSLLSTQAQLDFLPEYQTDFVFSFFAEEHGFIGAIILISLFISLILIGWQFAVRSRNQFGRLVAFGLVSVFSVNAFINLAMVTGMVPVVGIPLPFLSYGGSSMATVLISFGILMNVGVNYNAVLPTKFSNV